MFFVVVVFLMKLSICGRENVVDIKKHQIFFDILMLGDKNTKYTDSRFKLN